MNIDAIIYHPVFGAAITVMGYALAQLVQKRWSWMHPALATGLLLIVILRTSGIPYEAYKVGGDLIVFLLGPATVALGVPLYKQYPRIKKNLLPILVAITVGAISSMTSAAAIVFLFRGAKEVLYAMIPKAVTSPVAIEIVRHMGGVPELGATFAVISGILGGIIGPEFLRLCGVRSDVGIGTAVGTASHGIGTSRLLQDSEYQGSLGGFAMAANCIVTSLLMMPIYSFLH